MLINSLDFPKVSEHKQDEILSVHRKENILTQFSWLQISKMTWRDPYREWEDSKDLRFQWLLKISLLLIIPMFHIADGINLWKWILFLLVGFFLFLRFSTVFKHWDRVFVSTLPLQDIWGNEETDCGTMWLWILWFPRALLVIVRMIFLHTKLTAL